MQRDGSGTPADQVIVNSGSALFDLTDCRAMEQSWIDQLAAMTGDDWTAIVRAQGKTRDLIGRLRDAVAPFEDPNYSIVVTGSLGRGEAHEGSDADWILLVDGLSNPDHGLIRREIDRAIVATGLKKPGRTGTFGDLVTGHELVHYIAGARDTNENLTRRMLLLSESKALTGSVIRARVLRNVLARYVVHDRPVKSGNPALVPHFLLNDVVRYWRTMASDYASKMWERAHEGWALRNLKLRFSRKLLFLKGLLLAFSGDLFAEGRLEGVTNEDERLLLLADLIRERCDDEPLELLARAAVEAGTPQSARAVFAAYDEFLRVTADQEKRLHLENLPFDHDGTDEIYEGLHEQSRVFRGAVNRFFFEDHPQLKQLIREYGVF